MKILAFLYIVLNVAPIGYTTTTVIGNNVVNFITTVQYTVTVGVLTSTVTNMVPVSDTANTVGNNVISFITTTP